MYSSIRNNEALNPYALQSATTQSSRRLPISRAPFSLLRHVHHRRHAVAHALSAHAVRHYVQHTRSSPARQCAQAAHRWAGVAVVQVPSIDRVAV